MYETHRNGIERRTFSFLEFWSAQIDGFSKCAVCLKPFICCKPELFLLYAGDYDVYNTYKNDQTNPDSMVAKRKSLKMTHLLYDNFKWSSTLRWYVQRVAEKYSRIFELMYQKKSQVPSHFFHLNYSALTDSTAVPQDRRL